MRINAVNFLNHKWIIWQQCAHLISLSHSGCRIPQFKAPFVGNRVQFNLEHAFSLFLDAIWRVTTSVPHFRSVGCSGSPSISLVIIFLFVLLWIWKFRACLVRLTPRFAPFHLSPTISAYNEVLELTTGSQGSREGCYNLRKKPWPSQFEMYAWSIKAQGIFNERLLVS